MGLQALASIGLIFVNCLLSLAWAQSPPQPLLTLDTPSLHRRLANVQSCFITYRASRKVNQRLELHYGVLEANNEACLDIPAAQIEVQDRIAVDAWILLKIDEILIEAPKFDNLNEYFLRY